MNLMDLRLVHVKIVVIGCRMHHHGSVTYATYKFREVYLLKH